MVRWRRHPAVRRLLRRRRRVRVHLRWEAALRWRGRRRLLLRRVRPVRRHGAAARVCPNPNPSARPAATSCSPVSSVAAATSQASSTPRAGEPRRDPLHQIYAAACGGGGWSAIWRGAASRWERWKPRSDFSVLCSTSACDSDWIFFPHV